MEKIDLNKLKTFYYVALEGSYQKASVYLGIKSSYISKHITALEDLFKFKLFKRSHRSLVLTEKGEELLKSVQIMMQQIEKLEEISNAKIKDPDDVIRIVTSAGLTGLWLVQKLKEFSEVYPKYKLRIIMMDEKVDFENHYADIAIFPEMEATPNVTLKKLFTTEIKVFAAQKYLDEFGTPQTPEDLDHHRLISYYHNEDSFRGDVDWHLKIGTHGKSPRIPFVIINSIYGIFEAGVQGSGIITLPTAFPYLKNSNLKMILPEIGNLVTIHFATHLHRLHSAKVQAFENFLFN